MIPGTDREARIRPTTDFKTLISPGTDSKSMELILLIVLTLFLEHTEPYSDSGSDTAPISALVRILNPYRP